MCCLGLCSTLSHIAKECGLPANTGSLVFSTKVYSRAVEALSCNKATANFGESPSQADLNYFQGSIDAYATHEGYQECQGSVEYAVTLFNNRAVQEPYPELPWLREGQMFIRLADDKW